MKMRFLKLFLVINFLVVINCVFGQKQLINREIYNFEVGDVTHTLFISYFKNKNQFIKREFLQKSFSSNNDTVTYVVRDSIYTLVTLPSYKLSVQLDTLVYPDLDSFPSSGIDTSYQSNMLMCTILRNDWKYSIKLIGLQYTEIYQDYYLEGLGKYYLKEREDDARFEYTELRFYKKGALECGQRVILQTVSNSEVKLIQSLAIYPNPANNFIYLNWDIESPYQIFNIFGQEVLNGLVRKEIMVDSLYPGIYFLRLKRDGIYVAFKFEKV